MFLVGDKKREETTMRLTVRELLAEYTALLNKHGVNSSEAKAFVEVHKANRRFLELAELSRVLKETLTAPLLDSAPQPDHTV
jgi:hypothetical protein